VGMAQYSETGGNTGRTFPIQVIPHCSRKRGSIQFIERIRQPLDHARNVDHTGPRRKRA
jgi:hypothetical protein